MGKRNFVKFISLRLLNLSSASNDGLVGWWKLDEGTGTTANDSSGNNNHGTLTNYSHLWQIEKAFRISKTDLRIRPVYHYKRRRIEAHICIAFVAYSIYKELEMLLLREMDC